MSPFSDSLRELCERLGITVDWGEGGQSAVARRGDRVLFRGRSDGVVPFLWGVREGVDQLSWTRDRLLEVLGLPPAAETAAAIDELARVQAMRLELCRTDAGDVAALLAHPNARVRELTLRALARTELDAP